MKIKENIGLLLIIIGLLMVISIILSVIGVPLIIIGTYLLNKKVNEKEKEVDKNLEDKKNQLANIDNKLKEMEEEKEREINIKLKGKQTQLDNIDVTLEEMKTEQQKEIDNNLKEKKDQLANIDAQLEEKVREKEEEINIKLNQQKTQLEYAINELKEKKKDLIFIDNELKMQEIGLYEPRYNFSTAVLYKEKLDEIRKKQKELIKNKTAAMCEIQWEVDGSKQKGKEMTTGNIKQILRNFNLECEMIISKVKVSNRDNSVKRIRKAFSTLNKLNEKNRIKINLRYLTLKLEELDVAIEYELKKQEEKDILREERERESEEKKIQRQLDTQEKKIKTQKQSLENEIMEINNELLNKSDEEKEKLELKIRELELALAKSNTEIEQIADKRKRTGAGYVYILSNIGSFGENVYKIGVTRRDDPNGRVTELSDASVPFRFDKHVFIFSEEAFELEKELHNRFDHKRVNKVNMRKEFFHITIEDVKKIVEENKDLVHSFDENPDAQEYNDTLKIKKRNNELVI